MSKRNTTTAYEPLKILWGGFLNGSMARKALVRKFSLSSVEISFYLLLCTAILCCTSDK